MREIKFRVWHKKRKKYYQVHHLHLDTMGVPDNPKEWATCKAFDCIEQKDIYIQVQPKDAILEQYIGLKDKEKQDYHVGDKGQFDNGDTFIVRIEEWLEPYIEWIGDPECEDQTRDLYRIRNAKIIGNIHEGTK